MKKKKTEIIYLEVLCFATETSNEMCEGAKFASEGKVEINRLKTLRKKLITLGENCVL